MRAEELKGQLDALPLAAWRESAATVSAVLEGGPCPDPA
jgi:hypothetical protein